MIDIYRQRAKAKLAATIAREGPGKGGYRLMPEYLDMLTDEERSKDIARAVFDGRRNYDISDRSRKCV